MALTRKYLSAMGIEPEKIDEIINAHIEVVDAIKSERDTYKADAEKLPAVIAERDELKANAEGKNEDSYKVKYEAIKEEFAEFKKGIAEKETQAKKADAYRQILKDAGVSEKRIDSIMRVSDVGSIEFDNDGNVTNADKLTAGIKEEWADFITTTSTNGATVATPPANVTNPAVKTKKEIMEIKDTAERQQAWKDFISANQSKGSN